ncbi:carbohydrate kinase family protein [Phototrophicus methaneseepsis]|uniref:Carbohydrate kinase family protein n=1 Tax=Phototrophicus methaneseepsis TaxID=2710758 RepID=A0A7S8IFX2_9CHLR|nr:carbohydrate kinase family protein [Phototrophicus methaneseepsis]QPC83383.1 carbohydrate kinase family protein [Phototrophicus methaneseepsis]
MGKILVAGELNVDLVMSGLPHSPILGRELIGTGFQQVLGSSSAITAARLSMLGADVDFYGLVGGDDFGVFVLRQLADFGVHTGHIQTVDTPTGVTIALTYSQDRALLTYPGTIDQYAGQDLTSDVLRPYTHLHVGSFFLQTSLQPKLACIFEQARALGLTTSLDIGWDPTETWFDNPYLAPTLAHTDYFLPNEDEVTALAGGDYMPQRVAVHVAGALIVKRGSRGAAAYQANGEEIASVPSLPVTVIDTTGAGDAFNAGFIYATKILNHALPEALRFAAACGAQAVTQLGGATNAPAAESIFALLNQV